MKTLNSLHMGAGAVVLALGLYGCSDDGTTPTGSETGVMTDITVPGTSSTTVTPTTSVTPTDTGVTEGTMGGTIGMTGTDTGETTNTDTTSPTTQTSTDPSTGTTMQVTTMTTTESTGPMTTDVSTSTGSTTDNCPDGTIVCDMNGDSQVCDGMGGFKDQVDCQAECIDGVGCVDCLEGEYQCNGMVSQVCNDQNMWVDDESCDMLQGLMCDPNAGQCLGDCGKFNLGQSYIGCDYYPATLANLHETQPWVFFYAVVVANTTNQVADITVTRGNNMIVTTTVAANFAKVIQLPYVPALGIPTIQEGGPSRVVVDGSYRLRSTRPVTVYQYEPYDYTAQNLFSFTNDASLLLPVNTWTGNYIVASRNHWPVQGFNLPGFYAVVARQDNTTVTLTPSATGKIVAAGGGVAGNGNGVIVLNESDVLEVFTASGGNQIPNPSDLTGTIISADKPVEVFGGHKCTQIPIGVTACDRLEEAMLPIETLAKKYIVGPPLIPNLQVKAQMVRIIATEANTALTYDPVQNGAPAMLANAGDYAEIVATNKDFEISSDKKILVSQYFQSQDAGGGVGDPAMTLAVATVQYRKSYLIHAPLSYDTNFANVTAPTGSAITMDGNPIAGFTPIGATGYGVARIPVPDNADGNHDFAGDQAFGVTIYGYGQYTSYWYPGGLDLETVPQ
jgi:hypothetical protein